MSVFLALVLFFSISTIQAADINVADSLNSSGDVLLQVEDSSNFNELKATGSDNLSSSNDCSPLKENLKNQTNLISPTTSVYASGSFNVILKDLNTNNTLANKNINFFINDVNYIAKTDSKGIANFNLNLKPGTYTSMASFAGDNDYNACNLTSTVKVLSTVQSRNIVKYYNGATQYKATFFDSKGNVLVNKAVTITVNGKQYTRKSDNNGAISLPMNFNPGVYSVVSTNPVTGHQLTTTFKILSTITSGDLNKVIGDDNKFIVKFLKSNGKPLANKKVKIKINGKTTKHKTNSNGQVSLSFNTYKKGTYSVVCYNNDGLSKTNNVVLYSIASTKLATVDSYTFLPNDTKEIKVKLSTSLGGDSNSGKIIKIKINGDAYYKKTDSAGVVSFSLASFKKGLYHVEYSHEGNKFFKSSKATSLVTLLDTTNSTLTVAGITDFGYGAGTLFKVAYTAGGVPLINKDVTFNIGGKIYTNITDGNGIASVPINLGIGNYTISYRTSDDFKINGTSSSCQITVFKRGSSKLTWECGTSYKDSLQSFKVLLKDANGKPISNGDMELIIDSESYAGKTESNGYAKIETSVALGKYKVSVNFLGDNYWLPSSTSASINVELSLFGKGLNEKNAASSSKAYLSSSSHCPVNNAKIKSLVKSLTSGLTDDIDKAKAIFNFVSDNVSYSFYYNSHRGAVGTLNAKKGNCVDQSSLLVAMYRTAGFKARYIHGSCLFSSGRTGHVWTQVLIGKTWVCGDPSNYRNSLGKIVNWNTNSYKLKGIYSSVPF